MIPRLAEAQNLDEDAWDDLLNFIEERRVIPIIGPELLRIETDQGLRLLYEVLAEKLAARLSVDVAELPKPLSLNDVVCWYLGERGRREEVYTRLRSIMRELPMSPPAALRQLARITDFDLFVTTTFDPLLEQAINLERFGGQPLAEVVSYAPNRVADLPAERAQLQRPVVYHLLGRLSASPTYVVSDEDMLEFICALQSEHLTPEKLFHELEHNHLLLIGSDFSNWLARLFLRMAKRRRLSDPREVGEVFADGHTMDDERLVAFLQRLSVRTRVYSGAEAFVTELYDRWEKRRNSAALAQGPAAVPQRFLPPSREMPESAIFISYAREDLPAVQRLKSALDAAGLTRGSTSTDWRAATITTRRSARTSPAAAFSCPSSRQTPSADSKAISGGSGAMRWTARVTSPRAPCSSCRSASTTPRNTRRWCPTSSSRCTSPACRAASHRRSSCCG
jgi:hypothetical protein